MSEVISSREANAKRWRELLLEQAASGLSIRVFCEERQIKRHTFQYWREKFSRTGEASAKNRSSRFIAVSRGGLSLSDIVASKLDSPRITLPNGVTIDLGYGLDSISVNQFLLTLCGVGLSGGADAKS